MWANPLARTVVCSHAWVAQPDDEFISLETRVPGEENIVVHAMSIKLGTRGT